MRLLVEDRSKFVLVYARSELIERNSSYSSEKSKI